MIRTFTTNILLTLGASPAMVIETGKASQFAAIASALLINADTPTQSCAQAMCATIEQVESSQTPQTLDSVTVGALDYRRHFCHELLSLKPAAIRGNISEIVTLADIASGGWGVDTTNVAANAIPAIQTLAREIGVVVVVAGEVDYVTDNHHAVGIHDGDPLMTKVVGTGCALSTVVAVCCALPGGTLGNVASACHWMKQARECIVVRNEGPSSFVLHLLDTFWQLTQEVQA